MNAHRYPDGFYDWPLEERNEYFAKAYAEYDAKQRAAEHVPARVAKSKPKRQQREKPPLTGWIVNALKDMRDEPVANLANVMLQRGRCFGPRRGSATGSYPVAACRPI